MVLTFEKIRELYWAERDKKELQELPENFFKELNEYLKKKGEDKQIRQVVNDLINRRLKKIIESAILYLTTKIYPINLTEEEKVLFKEILECIKRFNEIIFTSNEERVARENTKEDESRKNNSNHNSNPREETFIVKKSLPPFVGPDLKTYKLIEGEKVKLPKELKEFLLKKNVIAKIG